MNTTSDPVAEKDVNAQSDLLGKACMGVLLYWVVIILAALTLVLVLGGR